jgi:hypothetical protein
MKMNRITCNDLIHRTSNKTESNKGQGEELWAEIYFASGQIVVYP